MYCNIPETYISFTEKNIIEYLKTILEINYDRKIAIELTKTYIDTKYYGYNIDSSKNEKFSKVIFDNLKLQYEKLCKKFPKKDKEIQENFYLFKYIFYFEEIKKDKTIEQVVDEISSRRVKKYNFPVENEKVFRTEFKKRIESDNLRRKEFLKKFDTDKFELAVTQSNSNKTIYNVDIINKVKFKDVFKEEAIERVFNSGKTAEDKLIVEYSLISKLILNDILKGKFEKKYLINYTISLLNKKRKNKQILSIIDNQAIIDKLILKISYKDFVRNKYDIYDLMKKGFRFAIVVGKDNNIDNMNLNMFKFILVTNEHPKLNKYINKFKNVVITEE